MTSLSELAFEMEFEEAEAAEPGAASVIHSAWTESEALRASSSSGWSSSTGWSSSRPASLESEGSEEPGSPPVPARASPGTPTACDVYAQLPAATAPHKADACSFQCVTHALYEFEPCPELDAIYAKYQQATLQEAAAQML